MNIQLPEQFLNRMRDMLGNEIDQFLEAYEEANYHGLRFNPLKAGDDLEEVIQKLFALRPVPWCQSGYYYSEEERPGRHPYHHAGAYYIQEPSAMLVGELAEVKPGMKVLDLCAAPGGKTSHLAGLMQGEGVLIANEIVPNRAKILSQNVERMGISNCIVTNESPDRLARVMPGYFDLIVVDTPCSGEGMFRRDEIARTEWSEANVRMCAERGQDILGAADKMLRYGGRLVYSTCTFAPDEDEGAIGHFLQEHPEYHIEHVEIGRHEGADEADGWVSEGRSEWCDEIPAGNDIRETFRLWPHRLHGEGHYAAVLKKGQGASLMDNFQSCDEASKKKDKGKKNQKDSKAGNLSQAIKLYEDFAKKFLKKELSGEYILFGDNLYLMPEGTPGINSLKLERAGLHLGEIKKDRFEPSHALAMATRPEDCNANIDIADEGQMLKYLCGETIECDSAVSGWCIVSFNGCSAGFGKANGGRVKNHYPKGLRIKM